MNRHVNSIAGRLSLRPPQRDSLAILDRLTEIVPLKKSGDAAAALAIIRSEYPTVSDFERDFLSICFTSNTNPTSWPRRRTTSTCWSLRPRTR
jgi:type III restriction enzyme